MRVDDVTGTKELWLDLAPQHFDEVVELLEGAARLRPASHTQYITTWRPIAESVIGAAVDAFVADVQP